MPAWCSLLPPNVPKPSPPSEAFSPPLAGRIVHTLVIATGTFAVAWLGWSATDAVPFQIALALAGGALLAVGWTVIYSPADPERRPFERFAVPGRVMLAIEVLLILAGGIAFWAVWHRAAGETYLTVAAIDLAVRYPRLAPLWRETTQAGKGR